MKLDMSRFKAYHENQNRFRLRYLKNLVGKERKRGIDRGIMLHLIIDGRLRGLEDAVIDKMGEEAGIESEVRRVAWAMYPAYAEWVSEQRYEIIASEKEFEVPIQGTKHSMVGKTDQIVKSLDSDTYRIWENKTAWHRFDVAKMDKEWEREPQAGFEIIGARYGLAWPVEGLMVVNVVESTPTRVVPSRLVTRSDNDLAALMLSVAQTCDQIEFMIERHGIDVPWPDVPAPYINPFSCASGCEYETVCKMKSEDVADWSMFDKRQEHLQLFNNDWLKS